MKTLRTLIPLVVLAMLGSVQAQAQVTVDLKVRNQRIVGSTYYFDVYLERTNTNDLYLGNADFVFTFDHANFSSPTFSYEASSAVLKNSSGSAITTYESNIATSVGTGVSANRLIVNVQPPAFSNQTDFNSNIAKIDNSAATHFLGTFSVTGMQNASTFPNLQWKTSGTGIVTKVYTLANSTPWRSAAATINGVNPTLGTEPSQTAGLAVTATTSTTVSLEVEEGGGTDRIILAKASSAVGSDGPADGINYTANAAFSSGSQIGSTGVYVVYKGSDTVVTVTGLTAGVTYHFAAYEFNGSNGTSENFNTTSPSTASTSTLASEPTVQASSVTFSSPTTSALTVTFTRGDGANHLVLIKSGSAVDGTPVDGTSYTASTTFQSGTEIGTGNYVVYNGTDSTFTVSGLTANTVYHIAVYEFNGSSGTENYLSTSPATGSRTTIQTQPTIQASSLVVDGATTTTLDLTWNNGNGARKIVVAKAGGAVSVNPTDGSGYTAGSFTTGEDLGSGNIVVYDGTDTSTTVTGLTANTTYHFAVYDYNGTSNAQNYLTSSPATGNGTTLNSEPTVQASNVTFGTYTTSSLVINFDAGNGANRIVLVKSGSAVDGSPTDGTGYTASATFGSGTQIGTGNYVVYSGNDTTVTVSGLSANTVYHVAVYELNGSAGTANYLTTSPATGNHTTLDNEPSTQVTSFTVSNPTSSTLDLAWSGGNGSRRIVVAKSGGAVNVSPTDGDTYTAGSFTTGDDLGSGNMVVYDGTGSSTTVTGLSQNTTYHFAIYVYDGTSGAQNYNVTSPKTANENTYMGLAVTAFLEGPYNGSTMDTTLKTNNYVPTSQPFNTAPWSYAGSESVGSIPNNVVDWVLVELRKSETGAANATSGTIDTMVAGFLLSDGSIVATDGSSALTMPISQSGTYYVVIHHRNHLPVMSASAITSNGTNYTFDFTSGSSQAYGTNAQIDMGSGVYGMYAGRVETASTEDDIDAADRSAAWSARNTSGYLMTDCTLDGNASAADRSAILNNSGKSSQVP